MACERVRIHQAGAIVNGACGNRTGKAPEQSSSANAGVSWSGSRQSYRIAQITRIGYGEPGSVHRLSPLPFDKSLI
jgi:hypothetical protein